MVKIISNKDTKIYKRKRNTAVNLYQEINIKNKTNFEKCI